MPSFIASTIAATVVKHFAMLVLQKICHCRDSGSTKLCVCAMAAPCAYRLGINKVKMI
jgi:hypothetical protein